MKNSDLQTWLQDFIAVDLVTEEMIEECASFPFGSHDDLCDSMTQALMRFREGGFLELATDYEDEPIERRERVYY